MCCVSTNSTHAPRHSGHGVILLALQLLLGRLTGYAIKPGAAIVHGAPLVPEAGLQISGPCLGAGKARGHLILFHSDLLVLASLASIVGGHFRVRATSCTPDML
eukprot:scaffold269_cov404-Prasinococcus_capsulatus_cf.AAC.27